jgi:hypothetical protein
VTGLSTAPTQDLKTLARAIERKTLRFPLTAAGVGRLVEHLPRLAGLSDEQAASLVECVLAERARSGGAALELVWTGPDVPETLVRDTAIVVRDLFASAQSSVLVGGCYFSGGEAILEPLYRGIKERAVQATVCLNIPEPAASAADIPGHVRRQVRAFIAKNWPFGMPLPRFYYDPRTVQPAPPGRSRIHSVARATGEGRSTARCGAANTSGAGLAESAAPPLEQATAPMSSSQMRFTEGSSARGRTNERAAPRAAFRPSPLPACVPTRTPSRPSQCWRPVCLPRCGRPA